MVPFFWQAFWAKQRALIRHHEKIYAVAGAAAARLSLLGLTQAGWTLDDLFIRRWRDAQLTGPLFILGHPRSGTTLLHRGLVEDALEGAHAMRFGAMLLSPIVWRRVASGLLRLDRRLGSTLNRSLDAFQQQLFSSLDYIHRLRFDAVEDDEFALWAIHASAMCFNDSPTASCAPELDRMRIVEDWPIHEQRRAMAWYRACLLKTITADGAKEGMIVAKNTAFSKRIALLQDEFPDALFVYLIRNPLEAIPSRLSFIQEIWRRRFTGFDRLTEAHVSKLVQDSVRIYCDAEQGLAGVPIERVHILPFSELVSDPAASVRRLLAAFHLPPPDPGFEARIVKRAQGNSSQFRHEHRYSLAEFGLDPQVLRNRLDSVFRRHNFLDHEENSR